MQADTWVGYAAVNKRRPETARCASPGDTQQTQQLDGALHAAASTRPHTTTTTNTSTSARRRKVRRELTPFSRVRSPRVCAGLASVYPCAYSCLFVRVRVFGAHACGRGRALELSLCTCAPVRSLFALAFTVLPTPMHRTANGDPAVPEVCVRDVDPGSPAPSHPQGSVCHCRGNM